jgi:hypothetical protein
MEKWKVQAVKREGFSGVWRAGRFWPSESAVEVEVLDDDDAPDPKVEIADPKAPGGKRLALDPGRLSRASFERLVKDGQLSKARVGDIDAAATEKELRARIKGLEAELSLADAEIRRLQEALSARLDDLTKVGEEVTALRAKTIESGHLEAAAGALEDAVSKAPPVPPPAPAPEQPPPEKPSAAAEKAAAQAPMSKRHK